MTVQEYAAQQTERIGESYCQFLKSTHTERLSWRPSWPGSAETRSILELTAECIAVNHAFAAIMRGSEGSMKPGLIPGSAEEACSQLHASVDDLAAAIRALSAEDLERSFKHPKAMIVGKNLILQPYRNMSYHAGQLNLMQILYGDIEFHTPDNWR